MDENVDPVHKDWNLEVQRAFVNTAKSKVELQNKMMLGLSGRTSTYIKEFRRTFNYLYEVTPNNCDLDQDVLKRTYKWLMTPRPDPMIGLKLFEEYRIMLNMNNLIGGSCRR